MDVFNYGDHFFVKLVQMHDPGRPLQVEFHPGIHCDLYRCPHCYGHGQKRTAGPLLTASDVARVLDDLDDIDPLIQMSGVATEPLTHPEAAAMIREIRGRDFRLGLHTKGYRLDEACALALTEGQSECFVTVSLDASNNRDYVRLHDIPADRRDGAFRTLGETYFDTVKRNMRRLHRLRVCKRSPLKLRAGFLLFADNSGEDSLNEAVDEFSQYCDLVRFSIPQDRNDGKRLAHVPVARRALLDRLTRRFAGHPKVRILDETHNPSRSPCFDRCSAQRFQVVIDKCGYVYPCPQVSLASYSWLSFGNVKTVSLAELLSAPTRRALFDMDVDGKLRCQRICDRKDDAINAELELLLEPFRDQRRREVDTQTRRSGRAAFRKWRQR